MALDRGPDMAVGAPGDSAREESRDVAKVRVTKGEFGRGGVEEE